MRHVMSQAIISARNPIQLPGSRGARCADAAPPCVARAKIFSIVTPIHDRRPPMAARSCAFHQRADLSSPATSAGAHCSPAPNDDETRFPHSG